MYKKFLDIAFVCCVVFMATIAFAFEPGTYEGEGEGFGSVKVKVTVDSDKIIAVEINALDETPGIGSVAIERASELLIGRSDGNIDAVTGATITSKGILEAVTKALNEARNASPEKRAAAMLQEREKHVNSVAELLYERLTELEKIDFREELKYLDSTVKLDGEECLEFCSHLNFSETGYYAVSPSGKIYEYVNKEYVLVK